MGSKLWPSRWKKAFGKEEGNRPWLCIINCSICFFLINLWKIIWNFRITERYFRNFSVNSCRTSRHRLKLYQIDVTVIPPLSEDTQHRCLWRISAREAPIPVSSAQKPPTANAWMVLSPVRTKDIVSISWSYFSVRMNVFHHNVKMRRRMNYKDSWTVGVDSCPNQTVFAWIFKFNVTSYPEDFLPYFWKLETLGCTVELCFAFLGKMSRARSWRYTLEQSPWQDTAGVDGKYLMEKVGRLF